MRRAGPNRWIGRWRGMGGGRGRGGRRPWSTTRGRHITIYASQHNTDTTSGKPKWCNVANMVCVVSATWRQHVGMSFVLGGKNPRHDADITSQAHPFHPHCVSSPILGAALENSPHVIKQNSLFVPRMQKKRRKERQAGHAGGETRTPSHAD